MAAKRLFDGSEYDPDRPDDKRIRTRPSFAAVIGQVVMVKSLQNFCSALEPLLRRVVTEEVENGFKRSARWVQRTPAPLQIQALQASTLQLSFSGDLSLPVFTGTKIEPVDGNPLQVFLVDSQTGSRTTLPYPVKVEIVALDGDFPPSDNENWTSEEFNNKIVRERTGKRPLLTGDVLVTMRDGFVMISDLAFTDNSSWIRSRNFRLGARVSQESCQGVRIREAITVPFVVKDHRGELYKKHHPPALEDDVWRLEKIGKDGAFHKKLRAEGIKRVQDFLKLWVVDPTKLRKILGLGMSDKAWEATIKHAKTCVLGNKRYLFRGLHYSIVLNPICQVVKVTINGLPYPTSDLTGVHRGNIENMVREAYVHWNSLEEVDGLQLSESPTTALLPAPGDEEVQYANHHDRHQDIIRSSGIHQHGNLTDGFVDIATDAFVHIHYGGGGNDWGQNLTQYLDAPPIHSNNGSIYNGSDSSDCDC
ncbi:Calmodulin binding protein-like [Macleaya cordata]|uniref:Calmodulin binding protein-like n=1 Tax=Macleaya cordata TaxID=56857 RepID=A0A200Q136_MACCD|nr:Calmodulin binding protein-like [Macleaya cordata]